MKSETISLTDKWIIGILLWIIAAEGIYGVILWRNGSMEAYALLLGIVTAAGLITGIVGMIYGKVRKNRNKKGGTIAKKTVFAEHSVYCLLFFLLIVFQIVWNFYMHEAYRETDIMGETVQTMLSTDSLHTINPMTGLPYTQGLPLRLKILALPAIYAAIVRWTGLPVQTVLYELVPAIVLALSYLVYSRYAAFLFREDRKKRCIFLLLVALIYQFGNYAPVTDAFRLFHMGYDGASIRAAVLLPFALLACLKGRWWQAVICALAEACLVWTLYGLGYTVLLMGVMACVTAVCRFLKTRGRVKV